MVQCLRAESLRRFTAAAALFVLGPSSIIQRIRITSSGRQGGRWSGQTGVSIDGVAVAVIVVLVIIIVAIGLMGGGGGRHGASCTVRSVCAPSVSVPLSLYTARRCGFRPGEGSGEVSARFRRDRLLLHGRERPRLHFNVVMEIHWNNRYLEFLSS